MTARSIETALAWFTAVAVTVYVPGETIASWKYGLASPYYIVDAIAFVLMFWGAARSLRARPRSAPAIMTVAWAWAGANFWRAALARWEVVQSGGDLNYGPIELKLAIVVTGIAFACVTVGMWLITRAGDR